MTMLRELRLMLFFSHIHGSLFAFGWTLRLTREREVSGEFFTDGCTFEAAAHLVMNRFRLGFKLRAFDKDNATAGQ